MKPIVSLDGSDVPLAYVITNAYPDDEVSKCIDEYRRCIYNAW